MEKEENKLLQLVENKFNVLSGAEIEFLQQIQPNETFDRNMSDNKTTRAEVIAWILTNPEATKYLTYKGLIIRNNTITGYLNLENLTISFPLTFRKCTFENEINLKLSNVKTLSLYRSTVNGCINLDSTHIDGQLICGGATFYNPDGDAFIAKDAIISRSVFFDLAMDDDEKDKPFEADGKVNLDGIRIGGKLYCSGGKFKDEKDKKAFSAENASIDGTVSFNDGFEAEGEVNLNQIKIRGQLICGNATFNNPDGVAFFAQSAIIDGSLFMNKGFKARGQVNLLGAKIYGSWDCGSGNFTNPGGHAINGKRIIVDRDVFFDKPPQENDQENQAFKSNGEVKLCGAEIGGQLKCSGGIFHNPTNNDNTGGCVIPKYAFIAKGLKVAAVLFDEGFNAIGEVNLLNAKINGPLVLKNVKTNIHYKLNLEKAFIRSLEDLKNSWPEKDKLVLDDLIYENIEYDTHHSKDRIEWLGLNKNEHSLQPYRQLASVLDSKGWENDARDIRIAMNDKLRKETHRKWQKFWLSITGRLFGYGYKPFKVWRFALIFWILGGLLYCIGDKYGLMQPPGDATSKTELIDKPDSKNRLYEYYPEFYAFVYSLDVFLPIVDLHQEEYWRPTKGIKEDYQTFSPFYFILISWMYFQILVGWILTTMLVGGLTGLIRNK